VQDLDGTSLRYWLVNAFSDSVSGGNPAALVECPEPLSEARMRGLADQLNHWTLFFTGGAGRYRIRTFSLPPVVENPFCGHAMVAMSGLAFQQLEPDAEEVQLIGEERCFHARRGAGQLLTLDYFPIASEAAESLPEEIARALGGSPSLVWRRSAGYPAWIVLYDSAEALRELPADPVGLRRIEALILATAPGRGEEEDFVSRLFAPMKSLIEDPAGGTQHALAAPFWAERLGKRQLAASSLSPRGGRCRLTLAGERLEISTTASLAAEGRLKLAD